MSSYKNFLEDRGLTVALVAPSRAPTKKTLSKAIKRLKYLGVNKVKVRNDILNPRLSFWAGSPITRANEIKNNFEDSEVDVIWCLNGGLSCLEILPYLNFDNLSQNKLLVGYSDITSLQQFMLSNYGIESVQYFMPGVDDWIKADKEFDFLENVLDRRDSVLRIRSDQVHSKGQTSGFLVGGCLDMLCSTLGTDHEIDTKGKILYLEDANISATRLYNDLCHLYLAGKFDGIAGLLIAKIDNCKSYKEFLDLFLEKLSDEKFPIVKEIPAGHHKRKFPFVIGGKCHIDTKKKEIVSGFSDSFKSSVGRPFHSS